MIYVSVTTIPQRIKTINKSIESLINQTVKPDKIFINIPKIYKRFEKKIEDNEVPNFPEIVEVTRCNDFGPGTKLLGSINKAKWNIYAVALQDLTLFCFSYLNVFFNYQDIDNAKLIYEA